MARDSRSSVLSPMFLRKIETVILNEGKDLRLPFYARNLWDTTLDIQHGVPLWRRPCFVAGWDRTASALIVLCLIPNPRQQQLDLGLLLGSHGDERRPRTPAIIAIEIAGSLYAVDPQRPDNPLARCSDSLLLFPG